MENQLEELICEHIFRFAKHSRSQISDDKNSHAVLDTIDLGSNAEFYNSGGSRQYIRRIQNLLLYYPSLHVFWAYPTLADLILRGMKRSRQDLKSLMEVLIELRELIQRLLPGSVRDI